MFELKHLIDVIKYEKFIYKHETSEVFEKMDVCTELNNRIVTIRESLVEDPENKNLSLELEFCENELFRLEEEIESELKDNNLNKLRLENSEKLIEYDLKELYQYADLLNDYYEFNVDESLVTAFKDSLDDLNENINKYKMLKDRKD